MLRRTKIVATLGPASSDPKVLEDMIRAGVNVVRMNFSHALLRITWRVRTRFVPQPRLAVAPWEFLADLQGPKIRVGKFENDKIVLNKGDTFILDAAWDGLGIRSASGLITKSCPTMSAAARYCC
ncbi:MAG: pyruvate kinase [Nitrosomonadales bacterium]